MTCREFKDAAASLTLLAFSEDGQMTAHLAGCPKCKAWLQERHRLAGAMQSLRLRTAGSEASPNVERALLQAFRQRPSATMQPVEALRTPPVALRLSGWFEVGTYAAVAAALLIALFLGYRVWHDRTTPLANGHTPSVTQPVPSAAGMQHKVIGPVAKQTPGSSHTLKATAGRSADGTQSAITDETLAEGSYTNLMFCDPLSCSGDAQVVRMELPAQGPGGSRDGQTVVADVVVGDDGLVRAVRIVN